MGAVGYRVVRWLRSTLRSSALMVVVVAVMASVPLALAAGARRTGSAPDRYIASREITYDVTAYQEEGLPFGRAISELPAVRGVEAITWVFGAISPGGYDEAILDGNVFAGAAGAFGDRLVAGRDPARRGEFVASEEFAERNGLCIGDAVRLFTLTPEQQAETGFSGAPEGPTIDSVLVGLTDGPTHIFDATGTVVFDRSLLDETRVATAGSVYGIDLGEGASIEELREQLDTIDGGGLLRLEAGVIGPEVRRAIDAQALGLWILAGLTGLVTIAALGQLLVRHARLAASETSTLSSLGATRLQVTGETAGRAGVIGAAALLVAAGVAMAASGIFPFGFVRRVEPTPGPHGDTLVLGVGAVVLAVGILGWVVVMTRFRRPASPRRRPVAVDSVAARCPTTSMATGVRFAFASRDSASVAARFGGAALMTAALVGTLVYAVSLQRLVVEPARYGVNFDFAGDNGADQIPPDELALLRSDPAVADVSIYTYSPTRVEGAGETLFLVGMERVRGLLDPPLLAGRLPAGPEEIAIGRVSARRLDVSIGDALALAGPSGRADYEITGLVVPPGLGGNDLVGVGGVVTSAGYRRLDPDRVPHAFALRLRADSSRGAAERLLGAFGPGDEGGALRPPAIANMARVTYVPFVLAVLLAVLAVLLVTSGAYTAVRQRNHEVAVLRTLGAERSWLLRTANWLAATSTLVPALIGIPLGFLAGRVAFRTYADSLGAINSAFTPVVIVLVGLVVLVLLAAVAATVGGRTARRLAPARLLHAE